MKHIYTPYNTFIKATAFACLFLLSACEDSPVCDCFKGTGTAVTEERPVNPFHYVELNDKVDLYVHASPEYRITVTAGDKLIGKVTTDIEGGVLRIHNRNKCNWVRDFRNTFTVHIYMPVLDTLEVYNSSGDIYFVDTIRAERFQFESWSSTGDYHLKLNCGTGNLALQTGPASLYAEGRIGVGYLWNQGQGVYEASALSVDDIYTTNRGMNNQYLHATNRFYAVIESQGNIYYKADVTDIKLDDYGGGEFIKIP